MTEPRNDPAAPIPRPRLVDLAATSAWVVMSAPSGYGKTLAAAELARSGDGPAIWCRLTDADVADGGTSRLLGALVAAAPHLGQQPPVADTTGAARITYALGAVASPATVVIDDLHLIGNAGDLLVDAISAAAVGLRVVVTTEGELTPGLVRSIAAGSALLVGPADLLFDEVECGELAERLGGVRSGAEVFEASGGWTLAAAVLARSSAVSSGSAVEGALVADALADLSEAALARLAAIARLSSIPLSVFDEVDEVGIELLEFVRRHPAVVDIDADQVRVREILRGHLLRTPASPAVIRVLVDRLERRGHDEAALMLLSRLVDADAGAEAMFQDRLDAVGPRLLDRGRFALVHELVTHLPAASRRTSISVLDGFAALGLDQLERRADHGERVDLSQLDELATRSDLSEDDALALAGIRTEVLRNQGDSRLVEVALDAIGRVGRLDDGVSSAELLAGRGPLARRGLFHVLWGLGVAAQYSGDGLMIDEGRRLIERAIEIASLAGIDPLPLGGQAAYERATLGLDMMSAAIAPLQTGVAALREIGHPDAAVQMVQLADLHLRRGELDACEAMADAALDWAERTGNELVLPSIAFIRAGLALDRDGPSAAHDRQADVAWELISIGRRLRRAGPSFALRMANAFLDHDDPARADRWVQRARVMLGERVQRGYQEQFLDAVVARWRFLSGEDPAAAFGELDDAFAAQPAGRFEHLATAAWDRMRRGDASALQQFLATNEVELELPWTARFAEAGSTGAGARVAGAGTDSVVGENPLRILLLGVELRVERGGGSVPGPTGHAARLLALLVVADGALTIDAALDDLWPDADPAAARNRFHQVLHRLRRSLGIDAGELLTVVDGVIRLDRSRVDADVWELRSPIPVDPAALVARIDSYESDLCSAQFAYDDAFDDARWELSRRLADVVSAALGGDGVRDEAVRQSVRTVFARLPEDGRIGAEFAAALERIGEVGEASEIRSRMSQRELRY